MMFPAVIRKMLIPATLVAAALGVPAGASGAVLNLSKDLVAHCGASSNMLPNMPTQDATPLFQLGVGCASMNGFSKVIAERGAYYFLTLNSSRRQHVSLNNISNLTVDLEREKRRN